MTNININGNHITQVTRHRHLGVTFDERLSRPRCYQKVCQENWTPPSPWQATVFNRCPGSLCIQHQAWYRIWQHYCLEWPQFLRCCTHLSDLTESLLKRFNRIAARLITKTSSSSDISRELLLACAGLPSLGTRRRMAQCMLIRKAYLGRHPVLGTFSEPQALPREYRLASGDNHHEQVRSPFMFSAQTNPTFTALSSSHHLEQICCRYSQQRPPFDSAFQTFLTNNSVHMRF